MLDDYKKFYNIKHAKSSKEALSQWKSKPLQR